MGGGETLYGSPPGMTQRRLAGELTRRLNGVMLHSHSEEHYDAALLRDDSRVTSVLMDVAPSSSENWRSTQPDW
jgi:hypothetical protein